MEYYITALLVVFVTIVAVLHIRMRRKVNRYWKERGIPYDASVNIVAILRAIYSKPLHEMLLTQYKKYGRIYGGFEFAKPVLTVCEPDLLRDILVKDFHIFNIRRDIEFADQLSSKMIIFLKGEDWKRVRTIISPAFTSRKMRQISHIIDECTKTVLETFRKYAEKGEPVDCKSIFGAFTVDVIARSAFATKIDSHGDPENIFVKNAKMAFAEPSLLRFLIFFLLPDWILKYIKLEVFPSTIFFRDVILQVVKERRESGKKHDDILQLFLEAANEAENETSKGANSDEVDRYGTVLSNEIMPRRKYAKMYDDELVAQCILFYMVGYETTASTLSFLAYSLALNPDCQEKLIAEVDEVFKNHKELDYDVIRDMKYLDCAVSETLRMYPAVTRSERTATEDYKLGNTGLTIEKGIIVGFNIHAMHFDPEFFPNPEQFDPERFMSENAIHPQYAYLPFGAGPRNCLGMRFALMEIKLCISNILRRYRFKKAETTKVPLEFRKGQGFLTVNNLPLIVEKRDK